LKPIFPKGIDDLKPVIFLTALSSVIGAVLIFNFYFTDAHLSVGYKPDQPIPFSHRLHAGEMGIDCRYCHVNVEKSPHATVPPSQVCMNCHAHVKKDSPVLEELRQRTERYIDTNANIGTSPDGKTGAGASGQVKIKVENDNYLKPIDWIRIHNLPDYAYFDHSVHVNANVGCVDCHGRIDQMTTVKQAKPLTMFWCLDCHRNYQDHVRPEHVSVTNMQWTWEAEKSVNEADFKKKLLESNKLNPPEECSACHR
jgi:hypothetical protein